MADEEEPAADENAEETPAEDEKSEESEEEPPKKEKKTVTIVLEEDSSKFKPQFYTFRRTDNKNVARGPPFWVLADHLIAVIWHLFKDPPSEEPIGISQLQWSLEFLRNIRDETGEYPEYVNAAICGLEDRLLELYASVPAIVGEDEEEEEEEEEQQEKRGSDDSGGSRGSDASGGGGEDEEGEEEEGEKPEGDEGGEEGEEEEEGGEEPEEEEEEETPPRFSDENIDRPSQSMQRRMSQRESRVAAALAYKELNSSVTLRDILHKAPKKPPKGDAELESLYNTICGCGGGASSRGTTPHSSQTKMSGSGTRLEGAAKNDMLKFLNSLRKEQTDRISIELKQLEKINEFLKEVESGECSYATMQEIKEKKR